MRSLLVAAAAALAMGGVARAADFPVVPGLPVAPPIFTWTGFYAGVTAGAAFNGGDRETPTEYNVPEFVTYYMPSTDEANFTAGLQFGINWQVGGLVAGLEADVNYLHQDDNDVVLPLGADRPWAVVDPSGIDWYSTIRARLGVAFGRTLLYATGGVAMTDPGKDSLLFFNYGPPRPLDCADGCVFTSSDDGLQVGWALGAGIEYAISNNVSFKLEYLHIDFGGEHRTFRTTFPAAQYFTSESDDQLDIVRAGLNVRF